MGRVHSFLTDSTKKLTLRETIEIVGVFGLIASLIFVGVQLMLDRRIAMGSQYHERMTLGHDWFVSSAENDDYLDYLARRFEEVALPRWWNEEVESFKNSNNLTMREVAILEQSARALAARNNNNYYQYQLGLISQESWLQVVAGFRNTMLNPINRAISLNTPALEPGYIELIRELGVSQ